MSKQLEHVYDDAGLCIFCGVRAVVAETTKNVWCKQREMIADYSDKLAIDHDPVNHPKHYTSHPSGVECITIVQHHNFNVGNAIKYLWRCGLKDGEDATTALKKAREYIDFELERVENHK